MRIIKEFYTEIRKYGIRKAARDSGVPLQTIRSWIYGKSVPSLSKAQKVADAMGLEFLLFEKLQDDL